MTSLTSSPPHGNPAGRADASTAARNSILVVDDDPDLLRLIEIRLSSAGYAVTTAASAEQALAKISVARPRLVVTDLRMSGMDGMALFEAVRSQNPALPVIILTAHGSIPDAVAAVKQGVFGYLTKPFDAKTLLAEVERAVAVSGGSASAPGPAGSEEWRRDIITRNPAMEDVLAKARLVAGSDVSVFILRRVGLRQGDAGARDTPGEPAAGTTRSSPSTAARFPSSCSNRSCSAT